MKKLTAATVVVIVLGIVYFAALLIYSRVRPIDADEGFYTTAARLVAEGQTPYQDFFYPQAPLLPYIYAAVWKAGGRTLESMRILSVACGAGAVLVWGLFLVLVLRLPWRIAIAAFACLLLNPYWISWNVVVKTYAVSNLFISLALISLYMALDRGRPRWFFAAGLALGATASLRSLYGPLCLLALAWVARRMRESANGRYSQFTALAAGILTGLAPMMHSFLRDPQTFMFNNLSYHVIWREEPGLAARLWEGGVFTVDLFLFHPYLLVQVVLFAAGALSLWRRAQKQYPPNPARNLEYCRLVIVMLLVFAATSLSVYPMYQQYFTSPLVPFLMPISAYGISAVFTAERRWAVLLAVVTCGFFVVEVPREAQRSSAAAEWQLPVYHEVAMAVESLTSPDDVVLSFWPGYVFESRRRYFPDLVNHFAFRVTERLDPDQRRHYHIPSRNDVIAAIDQRSVKVVVLGGWMGEFYRDLSPKMIQDFKAHVEANYSPVRTVRGVRVFRRRDECRTAVSP